MTVQTTLLILLCAFELLTVLDWVSTHQALKYGKGTEGNPLVQFFIRKLGLDGGLAAVTIPPIVIVGWYISMQPVGSAFEVAAVAALDLLYLKTVVSNFKIARE
jgi:hypothetical protein